MEMTEEWIRSYNQKCAEFLGKTYKDDMIVLPYKHVSDANPTGEIWEHCKFHSDWNWIMEVIEKIIEIPDGLGYEFKRSIEGCFDRKQFVIEAIDQFIDWYNKQKKL